MSEEKYSYDFSKVYVDDGGIEYSQYSQGEAKERSLSNYSSVSVKQAIDIDDFSSENVVIEEINSVPDSLNNGLYKIGSPYKIGGKWYYPAADYAYDEYGIASWYGKDFHGLRTANGEIYDMWKMTAAHPTLPLPSMVEVTNLSNNKRVVLRVNDRGPFVNDRIIDVSRKAAEELGFIKQGTTLVRVRIIADKSLEMVPPSISSKQLSPQVFTSVGDFHIRIGSFKDITNAQRLMGKLEQFFNTVYISKHKIKEDIYYRVFIGPFNTHNQALKTLDFIMVQLGYKDAFIATF